MGFINSLIQVAEHSLVIFLYIKAVAVLTEDALRYENAPIFLVGDGVIIETDRKPPGVWIVDDIHQGTPLEGLLWHPGTRPTEKRLKGIKGNKFYISVPTESSFDYGDLLRQRIIRDIEERDGEAIDPLDNLSENIELTCLKQVGRINEFFDMFRKAYKRNLRKIAASDALIVFCDPRKRYVGTASDT